MRRNNIGLNNPLSHNMSSGPLATEHYQTMNLKDIDFELELLKRKRQMLEQNMMENSYDTREYNNPSMSSGNSFNEVSHMYEDTRGNYGGGSSGRKRQVPVWEHESPPKRFSGNTSGPRKSFNTQFRPSQSKPRQPKPQHNYQTQQYTYNPRPRHPNVKKEFKPTKVNKPSGSQPMKNFNSVPPVQRKKLVAEASAAGLVDKPSSGPPRFLEEVLREDRTPSRSATGRLELALGHIMKEMKIEFPQYDNVLKNRIMKHLLRGRIRAVMMGRIIGTHPDIITEYRKSFPKETDKDVFTKALDSDAANFLPIHSADATIYFKNNLAALMSTKLEEMFEKLTDMYNGYSDKNNEKKTEIQQTTNKDIEQSKDKPAENAQNEDLEAKFERKIMKHVITTDTYKELHQLMEAKLPNMLRKMTPMIMKALTANNFYKKQLNSLKQDVKKRLYRGLAANSTEGPIVIDDEPVHTTPAPEKQTNFTPPTYFVKIFGKPSLPKRKQMNTFFEKYKPKSIKKHRAIHNLLFVGFCDKNDFDEILKADGTEIGRFTLSIKVSERVNRDEDPNKWDKKETDSPKVIDSNLDEQITDLLTTIKRSEGIDKLGTEEDVPKPDGDQENIEGNTNTDANQQSDSNGTESSTDKADNEGQSTDDVLIIEETKANETIVIDDCSEKEVHDLTDDNLTEQENDKNCDANNDETEKIPNTETTENNLVIDTCDTNKDAVNKSDDPNDTDIEMGNVTDINNADESAENTNGTDSENKNADVESEKTDTVGEYADESAQNTNGTENDDKNADIGTEKKDAVEVLKSDSKETAVGTPTRTSARLASHRAP